MTTQPIAFDPYDYALQDDPYPTYARLRAEAPLHHAPEHDLWLLSRHADVSRAFRDETVFSSAMGVTIDASAWGPDAHRTMSIMALDPPDQTRLRSLVSRAFTPRRIAELEADVRRLASGYLDAAVGAGTVDWIDAVAGRLPMDVICELMGVPPADRDDVRRLADRVVHRDEALRDVPPSGVAAAIELIGYYEQLVDERSRRPADDLVSALLAAEVDGERLHRDEVLGFLFLMVVAGNETTAKLLGNALVHLDAHPDQRDAVHDDPGLIEPWIAETLRHDTSTQMLARHLLADVEVDGVVAPAGSRVLLLVGSANRDETVFTRPDQYDVHRPRAELDRALSFGAGRHYCLGANLARLEARVTLEELLRRVSAVEVDRAACRRVRSVNVRGFAEVPVRLVPR